VTEPDNVLASRIQTHAGREERKWNAATFIRSNPLSLASHLVAYSGRAPKPCEGTINVYLHAGHCGRLLPSIGGLAARAD
jgi:hypothetical protein